jgi:hypothetical protein
LIYFFVGSLTLSEFGFKTELIGGKLNAGDATKMRAQNSKKNNFSVKKIERHIAYIDAKLDEYSGVLASKMAMIVRKKRHKIEFKSIIDKNVLNAYLRRIELYFLTFYSHLKTILATFSSQSQNPQFS